MASARHYDQDKDSTLYVGNLDERCTDSLVWELMLQAGPIINVHLPKDRVTQSHQGYGFVEFASEEDADYAAKIMNQIRLWGKPIRVNKASADKKSGGPGGGLEGGGSGVGAELFVGNLDAMVDEKVLFETFTRFGPLVAPPKISRDDSNLSKGYGFISYASFDSSDDAIANMHGQYLMNKEITVQYAYKKDGKGERHGDTAERALAAQAKKHGVQVAIPAMPAALVGAPAIPPSMNGYPVGGPVGGIPTPTQSRTPQPPPGYNYGPYQPPPLGPPGQGGYGQQMPPPPGFPPPGMQQSYQQGYQQPQYGNGAPQRQYAPSPMQAAPTGAGLPARPPPSQAGYGGPMGGPPGYQGGYQQQPPPGLPPGMPPGMPPPPGGFPPPQQQQQYWQGGQR